MKCPEFDKDQNFQSDGWVVIDTPKFGDCWYESIALQEMQEVVSKGVQQKPPKLILHRITAEEAVGGTVSKHDKVVIARAAGLRHEIRDWFYNEDNMDKEFSLRDDLVLSVRDLVLNFGEYSEADEQEATKKSGKSFPMAFGYLCGKKYFYATMLENIAYAMLYPHTELFHIEIAAKKVPYFSAKFCHHVPKKCYVLLLQNKGRSSESSAPPKTVEAEKVEKETKIRDIHRMYWGLRAGSTVSNLLNISGGVFSASYWQTTNQSHFSPMFFHHDLPAHTESSSLQEYRRSEGLE